MNCYNKFLLLLFLSFFSYCRAHEPMFGFGPELVRQGGCVIEGEVEHERGSLEKETMLDTDILYGVAEYLNIGASIPFFFIKKKLKKNLLSRELPFFMDCLMAL